MLNPMNTTTDATADLFRRLQSLEERADNLELGKGSEYNYARLDTPGVEALLAAHEKDWEGTMFMVLHEYGAEFEGLIQGEIFVKFPEGFYTI